MVYKPCTLSKALKEKSKGEDNSLAASIADEAFGLFLELMVSSFFTPMRSKHYVLSSNFRKSAKPWYVVTFSRSVAIPTNRRVSVRSADTFTRKQIWRATTEVRSLPCLSLNTFNEHYLAWFEGSMCSTCKAVVELCLCARFCFIKLKL